MKKAALGQCCSDKLFIGHSEQKRHPKAGGHRDLSASKGIFVSNIANKKVTAMWNGCDFFL